MTDKNYNNIFFVNAGLLTIVSLTCYCGNYSSIFLHFFCSFISFFPHLTYVYYHEITLNQVLFTTDAPPPPLLYVIPTKACKVD